MVTTVKRPAQSSARGGQSATLAVPGSRNLTLSVRHFGPVVSGDVELKPLTILIGANNSGKSYIAQLAYALSKVLSARSQDSLSFPRNYSFRDFLLRRLGDDVPQVSYRRLRKPLRTLMERENESFVSLLEASLGDALNEYFGVENLDQLAQVSADPGAFAITVGDSDEEAPLVQLTSDGGWGQVHVSRPDLNLLRLPNIKALEDLPDEVIARALIEDAWNNHAAAYGIPDRAEFYLPAARSGILAAWPLVTSMAISVVRRRLGPEPIEMAALSGVAGDFLQILIANFLADGGSRRASRSRMQSVLEVLEGSILKGQVSVEDTKRERSLLLYRAGDVSLPVQRASSMVAELAPLDLWVKQLLQPGDLLVIDEPEAHLHPENQRHMARVLVRLVRAGVRVVCPTHSSLIIHQLSNHILAKEVSESERAKLGFAEQDILDSSEVGVYRFDVEDDGTYIRSVPIVEGFGISEEEFVAVSEQIGDETYRLSVSSAERLEEMA